MGWYSSCELVGADSIQRFFGEKFRFEIAEPQVLAEAVAGDGFDEVVFAVGVGVVDGAVDEVVQTIRIKLWDADYPDCERYNITMRRITRKNIDV